MKTLVVAPLLPFPHAVNAGALVMYNALALLSQRHDVTVATFAGPDSVETKGIEYLRSRGMEVHHIWRTLPSGWNRWRWRWRLATGWLRGNRPLQALEFIETRMQHLIDHLCRTQSFDLIQVEYNVMGNYHYPAHLPSLLIEHEVGLLSAHAARQRSPHMLDRLLREAEWRRWLRHERYVWQRFDRIQVFTPRDAATIKLAAPEVADQVRTNSFGVDLPSLHDPSIEEPNTIVFVGGFGHPPNVDAARWLVEQIMPIVGDDCPDVRLWLVGDQPPPSLQALASSNVVVTGRVPSITPYLQRAALVVAPVRTGGGMRLKVLQAMAHGKAVVTTPVGAEGLAIGGQELPLVQAADAPAFARAITALLADNERRRQLAHAAHTFVAMHHTPQAYVDRLEAIYGELRAQTHGVLPRYNS